MAHPASWTLANLPQQTNKRILITGANSGIGYAAALDLARAGAQILLACRDKARGAAALERLRQGAPQAPAPELILLDLASQASIQQVAAALLQQGLPLNTLINNAGVMAPPKRQQTKDGFELQWGTNVLGHFALTCRLMPLLKLAPRPRVVTIASIAHKRGQLAFDDLESTRKYDPMKAYAQSKLGDLMFAFELQRRLTAAGLSIASIAAHPGIARTSLFKIGSGKGLAGVAEKVMQTTFGILFNTDAQGALPTVYAAGATEAEGGAYYGPQGFMDTRGGDVGPAQISPQALDQAAQQRLWTVCAEATHVDL